MTAASADLWPRAIAHVDLDQFYAAVEVLDFPELKGKPVIVGGMPGKRGVVSTASYEARKFGVHSAMPSSQAARLCPQAIWRKPRMSRYAELSRQIRAVFARFTDQIEPLSLDEAFLDLTGSQRLFGPAEKIARQIKDEVLKATGLIASVGLAENKFLAKIASDLRKPDAFVTVPNGPGEAERFLAPLPLRRLWGVGPKTCERLERIGLKTIGDVARADYAYLVRRLGEHAAGHLQTLARGEDVREVAVAERPKSVGRENTFAEDLRDRSVMRRELLFFAEDVSQRLRAQGLTCQGVTLKVRLGDFTTFTRAATFEDPTDLSEPLFAMAARLLEEKVDFGGQGVRLLGIAATKLAGKGESPQSLFPDEDATRRRRAAQAVDKLRERFGDDAVTRGRLLEGREETTGTPDDKVKDRER